MRSRELAVAVLIALCVSVATVYVILARAF